MRFDVTIIRIVFIAALVCAGFYLKPVVGNGALSAGVAALLALSVIFFETRIRKASLKTLIGGAIGSILGILGATLIGYLISTQQETAVPPAFKSFLTISLTLFMGYVGLIVGAVKSEYPDPTALGGILSVKEDAKIPTRLLG